VKRITFIILPQIWNIADQYYGIIATALVIEPWDLIFKGRAAASKLVISSSLVS